MRLHEVIEFPAGTVVPSLPADNTAYRMYRLSLDFASKEHYEKKTTDNMPLVVAMSEPEADMIRRVMDTDHVITARIPKKKDKAAPKPVIEKIKTDDLSPVSNQAQDMKKDWMSG